MQQFEAPMSELGQERRIGAARNISALPPRADVGADIVEPSVSARLGHWPDYSITSSARTRIDGGTVRPSALAVLAFTAISNFTGT